MGESIKKSREKLDKELKNFTGGNKERAVSSYVAKTLKDFCKEPAFANAVLESKKTLSDCCKEIMKKCGNHISDFEVYKKAAQFYFQGAKIDFTMSIKLDSDSTKNRSKKKQSKKSHKQKELDLKDIQISIFELEGADSDE